MVPARSSSVSRSVQGRLTILALAVLAGCTLTSNDRNPESITIGAAMVEFVVDGDTVDVLIGGQHERVRLIGIDTPESVSRSVPEQCFGKEASDALRGLLPPGTELRIERDAESRDRYGRLLLYLYRSGDELFVNQWLLQQGFADVLFFEPNTTFESAFTSVRNGARSDGLGLWSACDGPDQPLE